MVTALPLDGDGGGPDIRGHGEVAYSGDDDEEDGEVVEDSVGTRGDVQQAEEAQEGEEVDGGDGPQPVIAASGDVDVGGGRRRVDVQDVVTPEEFWQYGRGHSDWRWDGFQTDGMVPAACDGASDERIRSMRWCMEEGRTRS